MFFKKLMEKLKSYSQAQQVKDVTKKVVVNEDAKSTPNNSEMKSK